jgi:hypothetical protein
MIGVSTTKDTKSTKSRIRIAIFCFFSSLRALRVLRGNIPTIESGGGRTGNRAKHPACNQATRCYLARSL